MLVALIKLIRLGSPTGLLLLFLPCAYVIALSSITNICSSLTYILLGSFAMRSAGCIINDLADRKIDRVVARTRERPLASGVVSTQIATYLLIVLLLLALYSWVSLPYYASSVPTIALALLGTIIYPFTKRFTYFAQVFLGAIFNMGTIVTSQSILGYITPGCWAIYAACLLWTVSYDTVYGFMDIKYDKRANLKSFAILIHNKFPKLCIGSLFSGYLSLIFISAKIYQVSNTQLLAILLLCIWLVMMRKLYLLELSKPSECRSYFNFNAALGIAVLLALIACK